LSAASRNPPENLWIAGFSFPGNSSTFTIFPFDVDRAFAKMDKIRDSNGLFAPSRVWRPVMPSRCGTTRPRRHRFQAKEDCCFCRGS
jgi:hypothetical protein